MAATDLVFDVQWNEGDDYVSEPERVPLASLPGVVTRSRVIYITPALVKLAGVPEGAYEHVGEASDGAWIYAPLTS